MSVREEVHRLVDELSESDLVVVKRLLRGLKLPDESEEDVMRAFLQLRPEEHEPIGPEEQEAVSRSWDDYDRGAVIRHEELVRPAAVRQPK